MTWIDHVNRWKDCQLCPLGQQRSNIVLAKGVIPCDILFCGEAPGVSEDLSGKPFDGPAGCKLDEIIEEAGFASHRLAFTNLVACFPAEAKAAGTNEPCDDEIAACKPRLEEFIALANPRMIVCVGGLARDHMDQKIRNPVKLLSPWLRPVKVPMVDITHPAHMLRQNEAQKQSMIRVAVRTLREAADKFLSEVPF